MSDTISSDDLKFLKQSDQTKPAGIDLQSAWYQVLLNEQLQVVTDPTKLSDLTNEDDETSFADVLLTWTPKHGTDTLLTYNFSSERNTAYFSTPAESSSAPANNKLINTAWAGDAQNSGVLLIQSPASNGNVSLRTSILPAFAVDLDRHPVFQTLLAAVDATQTLTAALKPPPDWIRKDNKLVRPPTLGSTSNVLSRAPTNGLWCSTQDSKYTVAIAGTYSLSLNLVAVKNWLQTNFSGLTPSGWASATSDQKLEVELTLTRWTTYDAGPIVAANKTAVAAAMKAAAADATADITSAAATAAAAALSATAQAGTTVTLISLAISLAQFKLHVDFQADQVKILLVPTDAGTIFSMIDNAFDGTKGDLSRVPSGDTSTSDASTSTGLGAVYLWHVGLSVSDSGAHQAGTNSISWQFGIIATLKLSIGSDSADQLAVAFSYDSRSKTFFGRTLFKSELNTVSQVRSVDWDPRLDPVSVLVNNGVYSHLANDLDILKLVGLQQSQAPTTFALESARVSFRPGSAASPSVLQVYGQFKMPQFQSDFIPFSWDTATIDVAIMRSAGSKTFSIGIADTFTMTSSEDVATGSAPLSARFALGLRYDKTASSNDGTWQLNASAVDISMRMITSFFDPDVQEDVSAVMQHIVLSSIYIRYSFSGSQASSFLMTGVLKLGDLNLNLTYSRDKQSSTSSTWKFHADIDDNSPSSDIATIADSIVPGSSDKLPGFVGSIPVDGKLTTGPICSLDFDSDDTDAKGGRATALTVWLQIAGLSLTFVQYKTRAKKGSKGVTKRILRISVDQIPMMEKIPLVGTMPQPFDHLVYLWVEDDNSKLTGTEAVDSTRLGFTQTELEDMKSLCPTTIPPFQVKESSPDSKGTDIKLAHGHHFIVVVSGRVVLDHVFNTSRADSAPDPPANAITDKIAGSTDKTAGGTDASAKSNATQPVPEAQPTKGGTSTTAGPLSINALTLQFKSGHLLVSVDATLKLGPLTFSVIGFTIDINLKQVQLDHLADIVQRGLIEVGLHGIEVGLTKGPLTLNGVFIHDKTATHESYRGGIAVGFKAWQVLAVGEYFVQLDSKGAEDYKAVFVYGKLDGPLIELEFATISGVRVGFGYNYAVRMPELQELTSFPLISDSGIANSGNDPLAVLQAFEGGTRPFVYPKKGSGWFAAGMTITAFDLLTLTAVLVLDIDTGETNPAESGIIIAMFADGVFQMEPLAPPDLTLFYIELVIKVELNFVHGYIVAEAAIAPASHVYVPMAHLTGQASFYTWFGNNPHAGDWVVSIGGYARSYTPLDWYPRPARVALNFTVGDNIHLIGQAYCAVTPKCAMAGGSLHLSLDVGPVSAYADLTFDAFINFKPFHFRAGMSLAIGVECDIDILFVHIHISIHLSADLVIWGPHDFGGRAHVDFWFFGFDITFGADENSADMDPAKLSDFIDMVIKPGPANDAPPQDTVGVTGSVGTQHKYSIEDGLAPQPVPAADGTKFPSTGATKEWQVLAGTLQIRIDCGFALSEAHLVRTDKQPDAILQPNGKSAPDVYSWPMHCSATQKITSSLKVTIREIIDDKNQPIVNDFKAQLVLKTASTALWSAWSKDLDPLHTSVAPDHLKNGDKGTVDLAQAVRILPPDPKRARGSSIMTMDAAAAMMATIPTTLTVPSIIEKQPSSMEPEYFEAGEPSGVKRWGDFQDLWNGKAASSDRAEIRSHVAELIVDTLEWNIRPPAQMSKNPGTPSTKTIPAFGTPRDGTVNTPRLNADGKTDWQLVDGQPTRMIALLGTYYQALPYVCGS